MHSIHSTASCNASALLSAARQGFCTIVLHLDGYIVYREPWTNVLLNHIYACTKPMETRTEQGIHVCSNTRVDDQLAVGLPTLNFLSFLTYEILSLQSCFAMRTSAID